MAKMDLRWKRPFTCLISGATRRGNTYFVKTLLQFLSSLMTPLPDEVIWCLWDVAT